MPQPGARLAGVAFVALLCCLALAAVGSASARRGAPVAAQSTNTFDLRDFGAAGDGVADDAPALQAALDALAAAGGGTLTVPAGRYLLLTPVAKNFSGLASSVAIRGVPSSVTVNAGSNDSQELARGLGLVSEFQPATGPTQVALSISGLEKLLVSDLTFIGTPGVTEDAFIALSIDEVEEASVYHCEFYGLSTSQSGGAILSARRSGLRLEQTKFLGSFGASGRYVPVVQTVEWKAITVADVVFLDYGLRPELFCKCYNATLSWLDIGSAAPPTNLSPRREAVLRRIFMDEGAYLGLTSLPLRFGPSAPVDLIYVTSLRMNVSNFGTTGHYLVGSKALLVEDSRYGWSHYADSAINVLQTGDAILNRVRTEAAATRLRADANTARLTVINSVYQDLASAAQATRVIQTVEDADDPVWYVRREFVEALGREPDPAGHYYWTRRLLNCADADAACVAAGRAALADYLGGNPAPNFTLEGVLADEFGRPVAGAAVALSGSQAASTVTDAEGRYRFSNLPTSGAYTVSASKRHYTFDAPQVITTPASDVRADVSAALNRYAVRGRVTELGGAGVAGAAVTLSGSQAAETTTDAAGNYSLHGLAAGGSYTVSASSPRYTFAPASLSFTDLVSDRAADFTATPRFHTIAGRLAKSDNSGVAGVTVTLSGSKTATATTDAQGNYSFADLPRGGSYTVTPAVLFGHTFSPASQTFDNVTANKAANFTAVTTNYKITGRVAEGGTGLSGVTLSLSGSHTATATTDSSGNYTLSVPAHGSYTVTPSRTHYTFAPASASFNAVGADRAADFSATLNRHKISGRVARPGGAAMAGVTVTLSGAQTATATTDAQGNYSFTSLPAGRNYTVTPSRAGYGFAPGNKSFNNLASDQTADFSVTPSDVQIAGRVTAGGSPLAAATVTLSGTREATATTDAQGNYSFAVSSEGSYTVTPSKRHYTFGPAGASFTNPTSNRTADFTATLVNYTIGGRITDGAAPLAAATVTLSGAQAATATTDAQGNYSFSVPAEADYAVTVSKRHYTFTPASRSFTNVGANQTADFTAALNRHAIAGRVMKQDGSALQGATITLSGSQSAATTTDASGNYSFTSLPAGGTYTVSVARAHYTFASASQTFNDLGADRAADFTGALVSYRVSGRATEGGAGVGGVTVAVTGSRTTAATTDADGHYSFTLPAEGSYAVTASKRHYTFAPASVTFSSLDGDKTSDFAATLNRHSISGRVTKEGGGALAGAAVTLSGSQAATATTDASGNFAFANLPAGGTYTVSVTRAHYSFAAPSQTFQDLAADRAADFTGALVSYRVAGRVTEGGAGLSGVTINLSGSQTASATTDADGGYSFTLPAEGAYAITPSKRHYTFAPAAAEVASLDGDKAADFTAALNRHAIAGRVTTPDGAALPGATVTLSGAQTSVVTTDAQGNYSFAGLPAGGNYTVGVARQHYSFATASRAFNDLAADQAADFAGALVSYRVTGRVTEGGAGVGGVTVAVTGSQTAAATTDAAGNYSFTLPAEGSYTITPSKRHYTFAPAAAEVASLDGDKAADFTAGFALHRISGRIAEKGAALPGVTVSLAGTHPALGAQAAQAVTAADGTYSLAVSAGGDYVLTPSKQNYTFDPAAARLADLGGDRTADFSATQQTVVEFGAADSSASEGAGSHAVTVTRAGDTSGETTVTYTAEDVSARQGHDLGTVVGLLTFAPGETTKTITLFITDDVFVEGPESVTLRLAAGGGTLLGGRGAASFTIRDNDTAGGAANPIDDARFFVRQHYRDFLNREPDQAGLDFWAAPIEACGADAACAGARRVDASAAFFLSIEFQETGFLVHRMYKASFGRAPRRVGEFLLDSRLISDGVAVGAPGWAEKLAANKRAFYQSWVRRPEFRARFDALSDEQFADALVSNMGLGPAAPEREALLADLRRGAPRHEVLAGAAEGERFSRRETNPAFVLMQYFGYLQRDPDEAPDANLDGYNFWLRKLEDNRGDWRAAEMVKAFLVSIEYRHRFGQ